MKNVILSLTNSLGEAIQSSVDSVHIHFLSFLATTNKWQDFFKETVFAFFNVSNQA
jgi:hypothetical protein